MQTDDNIYHEKYVEFVGEDCIQKFIDYVEHMCKEIILWDKNFETRMKAERTYAEIKQFNIATFCYLCKCPFSGSTFKNFDHCHLTGKYRGAACARCNFRMVQVRRSLVIYFHNYRGYDNHHIVFGFASRPNWNIDPIAQNMEKKFYDESLLYGIGI